MTVPLPQPDGGVLAALSRMGLLRPGENPRFTPLAGGVASDIWKAECGGRVFCVKRALGKLRVKDDWQVTVDRSSHEVAWLRVARKVLPAAAPEVIAADDETHLFAMTWLPPETYPNWKGLLMQGQVRTGDADAIGTAMAAIHSATAGDKAIAERFRTDDIFRAIRLDAYLTAAGGKTPELRGPLAALIDTTARNRLALVHGDMSPKNILIGPDGPVFLDAECAWYGDPAFDLAFCLNHLLLKCLWRRDSAGSYMAAYAELSASYLSGVDWEDRGHIEERAAHLLPGLLLARIDGKSPVEYLTDAADRSHARRFAGKLLRRPVSRLDELAEAWSRGLKT